MELFLDRLSKQYKNKIAVDRFTLKLKSGVYGLLGANGAGKTTLLRMICGILTPTGGTVSFDGIDVNREDYRDKLGYLPQDFGYYPDFIALDFLLYMGCIKGLSKSFAKERALELLKEVSLSDVAKRKIKTFSGGMKQRLGIAQALLNDPQILILDEPTAGLDPKERVRFRNLIAALGKDRIVLLSTHIVSDIEHPASTILIMKDGQLLQNGCLGDILTEIENRVYECTVDDSRAEGLMTTGIILNSRSDSCGTTLRLVANEKPCEGAALSPATLEDLYLYYFREGSEA